MIKMAVIYFSITGYLLQQLNIQCCRKISHRSIFSCTDVNDISIHTKKVEVVQSFMISDDVYMTHPLNILKMKVIANIKL